MTIYRAAFLYALLAAALTGGFAVETNAQTIRAQGFGQVLAGPKAAVAAGKTALFEREREAFALINRERAAQKLAPLVWSDEVAIVARVHSENMVKFDFFSHAGRDGSTISDRAETFGLGKWLAIGENIAFNRGYADPCAAAVEQWMQSPGHRANILGGSYQETGIGIAVKPDGSYYFTQVFLKR